MKEAVKKSVNAKVHEIDATGQSLGRLATRIATILRGKHKVTYVPYKDEGDTVHITNIKEIKITGNKMSQKVYHSYSGYPGGLKTAKLADIFGRDPGEVLKRAVQQMLPPTRLRKGMMKRLHVK